MLSVITLILILAVTTLSTSPAVADRREPDPHDPRLAVATDPLGLVAGRYALSTTIVTRYLAVRGDVEITTDPMGYAADAWRASVGVPLYLQRPLHGPFVEPGIALVERGGNATAIGIVGGISAPSIGGLGYLNPTRERSIEPQIFVGWTWMFESGLHLAGAIGVSRQFAHDGSGTSVAVPTSYLRVGYAL